MSWLSEIARPEIRNLRAYEHAVWEPGHVRLHANELPWRAHGDASRAGLNRYPEPHPYELTAALAAFYGVAPGMLLAARGSDEAIDLLVRSYCSAGTDAVLISPPTFGMYGVAARVQGARVIEVPLRRESGWSLDISAVRAQCTAAVKLVFLCSPNNPTGNLLAIEEILTLAHELAGRALIVVDEAYVEFASRAPLTAYLASCPGLVLLRTLSKAHGLAGARCGCLLADEELVALLRKVIQPYAVTQLSIEAVTHSLGAAAISASLERIAAIKAERTRVAAQLAQLSAVRRVWPSEANFLLVEFLDPGQALTRAHRAGLLIRDLRHLAGLQDALRLSIGTPEQNDRLLASFT
jgi:histidinol-phosphate aminotransferase